MFYFQYTIDPIVPTSVTISHWYYQTGNTYFDNIIFISKDGNYGQSIALNQGHYYIYGTPTLLLNSAYYSSYSYTPINVWVYITTVYNNTASEFFLLKIYTILKFFKLSVTEVLNWDAADTGNWHYG
jgi:hypothetical protein